MATVIMAAAILLVPSFAASGRQTTKDVEAASESNVAEKQGDLKSLRAQIDTLRREMTAAEGSRKESTDQLKDIERAISVTQREQHQLATQINALHRSRQDLEIQSREIEQRLKAQQAQLGKLLYRQYLRGNPDPLRLLLNGDDPHQLARDLHYLEAIGRARSALLREIETSLDRQQSLATDMRQQAAQLLTAEAKRKEEHAKLLAQREQRQATLDRISTQIATQRREIGNLQRNEKQLAGLVDRLSKIIATRAAAAREARREAQRREEAQRERVREQAQRELARREATRQQPSRPDSPVEDEPAGARPAAAARRAMAPETPVVGDLARMKGTLHLPTRGAITNRFGTARQEGSTWKGLFIRASTGSEVGSIAGGRVVFAEWMRGFGNLLIIDHGSSYLSIYANNDSLLKEVGEEVRGGETIATVGNTGGNPESGLYFEIRHQGKPLDPLAWIKAR